MIVWMGFRLFAIVFALQRIMALRDPKLVTAGCLVGGYIILEGIIGNLGVQPPLAIWFWLAVGTAMIIEQMDKSPQNVGESEAENIEEETPNKKWKRGAARRFAR